MKKPTGRTAAFGLLIFWVLACQGIPALAPTPSPTPTLEEPTATAEPTRTATPTVTATPFPSGHIDTRMEGTLSIQGVVKDSLGNPVPRVFVTMTVFGAKAGFDIGELGNSAVYTDERGSYSFDNLTRLQNGHYELWFNGGQEYGKAYENSGHFIQAGKVLHNLYTMDAIVHAVTHSALVATVHYVDVDGSSRAFYAPPFVQAEPGHIVELWRGKTDKPEYPIGAEYGRVAGGSVTWEELAGGTYFLAFTYRRQDGLIAQCHSPSFDVLPGETKNLDYTIQGCSASQQPILP